MNTDFSFHKSRRLRRAADFSRVYARRLAAGDSVLLVFADSSPEKWTRIGLSVSRKHGNAVKRQRIKRLLREAFRLEQHEVPPGLDLILIPRVNQRAGISDYRTSLLRLTRQLSRRIGRGAGRVPLRQDREGD